MSRHVYYQQALAEAKARGLTPAQVRDASYAAVCNVLGIDKDAPPSDFFYRNIRRRVADEMQREIKAAEEAALISGIRDQVRALAGMGAAEVEKTPDGWLVRLL